MPCTQTASANIVKSARPLQRRLHLLDGTWPEAPAKAAEPYRFMGSAGIDNAYLLTHTLDFCNFCIFCEFFDFVGAMAGPWPGHGPAMAPTNQKKT
jgi:hypothetical protein